MAWLFFKVKICIDMAIDYLSRGITKSNFHQTSLVANNYLPATT